MKKIKCCIQVQSIIIDLSMTRNSDYEEHTLFFSHCSFCGQCLAIWSFALQMKQLSPGFIPGILSGCFLGLLDLFSVFGPVVSDFLRLNFPSFFFFLFFFFLLGSFGEVGSGFGNNSGWASFNRLRAIFCLLLTMFYATIVTYAPLKRRERQWNFSCKFEQAQLVWNLYEVVTQWF